MNQFLFRLLLKLWKNLFQIWNSNKNSNLFWHDGQKHGLQAQIGFLADKCNFTFGHYKSRTPEAQLVVVVRPQLERVAVFNTGDFLTIKITII